MFGPRLTTIFRSRWRAVWFVLSVLAGAYWSVPHGGSDKPDPNAQADVEAVASLVQGQQAPAPQKHFNPWAKTAH